MQYIEQVKWDERGLVPAIAQDATSGQILMMAWMNRQALEETVSNGIAVYWSRSRNSLWRKGESSGHTQKVRSIKLDCDGDTVLLEVEQSGVACHTGRLSCFYRTLEQEGEQTSWKENAKVLIDPKEIYS